MEWFSQRKFAVRLEWGISAVEHLAKEVDCVVIVDVMSFSTCVSLAVNNGASTYPYPWKDASAVEYGMKIGAFTASPERRFGGEGYSLSPASIKNISDGEKLVLPSPNGSAVSFKARDAGITVLAVVLEICLLLQMLAAPSGVFLLSPAGSAGPMVVYVPALKITWQQAVLFLQWAVKIAHQKHRLLWLHGSIIRMKILNFFGAVHLH